MGHHIYFYNNFGTDRVKVVICHTICTETPWVHGSPQCFSKHLNPGEYVEYDPGWMITHWQDVADGLVIAAVTALAIAVIIGTGGTAAPVVAAGDVAAVDAAAASLASLADEIPAAVAAIDSGAPVSGSAADAAASAVSGIAGDSGATISSQVVNAIYTTAANSSQVLSGIFGPLGTKAGQIAVQLFAGGMLVFNEEYVQKLSNGFIVYYKNETTGKKYRAKSLAISGGHQYYVGADPDGATPTVWTEGDWEF